MSSHSTSQPTPQGDANRSESLLSIAWKQFRKHPLARFSMMVLITLYILAAFADFVAPYPEGYLNRAGGFQAPTTLHWRTADGTWTRPYVCVKNRELNLETFENVWKEDCTTTYAVTLFTQREFREDIDKGRYVPFPVNLIPETLRLQLDIKPWMKLRLFGIDDTSDKARIHLWGSDDLGRDIFGDVLFGARISLTIGIIGALFAVMIGAFMGGLAGYFGGWADEIIMRLVEAFSAIPTIFLLIALSSIFYPLDWPSTYVFLAIVVALALIGWGGVARSVRGLVYSFKEQEFAVAAKALGARAPRVITRHLLPQTLSYIIVYISLVIPGYILLEAVLSFYGLGIQAPATSWGLMLKRAQDVGIAGLVTDNRWWIFIPGMFIFVSVLVWNLFGDGLRDAFDPRSRQ